MATATRTRLSRTPIESEPPQTFQSIYTRIHTFQSPDHASDAQHGTAVLVRVLVDGARAVFTGVRNLVRPRGDGHRYIGAGEEGAESFQREGRNFVIRESMWAS